MRGRHHHGVKSMVSDADDDSPMTDKESDYVRSSRGGGGGGGVASSADNNQSSANGKPKPPWSRELRNRFVMPSGRRRSLRFTNADGVAPQRRLRSSRTQRADYSVSQSDLDLDDDLEDEDDEDDDDDDDEDERIFTPIPRRVRLRHSARRGGGVESAESSGRMGSSVGAGAGGSNMERRRSRRFIRKVNASQVPNQEDSSIRRSTRVRKLKYENYSDSWIVGSQTLRGYPSYGGSPPYSKSGKLDIIKEEEEEEEEDEDEDEEDMDVKKMNGETQSEQRLRTRRQQPQQQQQQQQEQQQNKQDKVSPSRAGKSTGSQVKKEPVSLRQKDDKTEDDDMEEDDVRTRARDRREDDEDMEEELRSRTRQRGAGGSEGTSGYQDMYARVKQRRAANRKSAQKAANRRQSSSGSDSMSSQSEADTPRPMRRLRSRAETRVSERKYHLRQTKPTVDRFQAAEPDKRRSVLREVLNSVRKRCRRNASTDSSTSNSDSSPGRYDRSKKDRITSKSARPRPPTGRVTFKSEAPAPAGKENHGFVNRHLQKAELCGGGGSASLGGVGPSGSGGASALPPTSSLADVDPLTLDATIRFANVGGLRRHIECLKEMVVFPIMYSEIFSRFGVTPPKGVLFHGPPGTGKTLVARALANECRLGGSRKVSFFMRKGADCLSKWVGESERQLRLLFDEAMQAKPSIIFFDELDGLAPVRSTKQDQIHASIVCTLLALMDGLDNRGDIVVIGATNRIDSIDPALRRPGRFDRELHFPLPGVKERREILAIHSGNWATPGILNKMAELSAGYCGSDLKALCTEAVIQALKRVYPQIYGSDKKLVLDPEKVKVEMIDYEKAFRYITPASQRAVTTPGKNLPAYLRPLLGPFLGSLIQYVLDVFPPAIDHTMPNTRLVKSPRVLIVGSQEQTSLLSMALLYKLEHCPILSVGLENLYSDSARSPEETVIKVFRELPHSGGSILWFGDISLWWSRVGDSVRAVFTSLVSLLDPELPVLFLATSSTTEVPDEVSSLFSQLRGEVHIVSAPTPEQKESFFRPIFKIKALRPPPPPKKKIEELECLEEAPPPPPPKMSDDQLNALYHDEENTLRELRIFLRQICAKLARNKQFYMFSKPVDINEVPDYLQIVKEPMDLETMMTKIDLHRYTCAQDFLNDIDLLCRNALEYNPDRDPADKLIRHRACYLRDTAYALIKAEMDSDFEISCRSIRDSRKARQAEPAEERFAREFFPTDQQVAATAATVTKVGALAETEAATETKDSQETKEPVKEQDAQGHGMEVEVPGAAEPGVDDDAGDAPSTPADAVQAVASATDSSQKRKRRRNMWGRGNIKKPARHKQQQSAAHSHSSDSKNTSVSEAAKVIRADDTQADATEDAENMSTDDHNQGATSLTKKVKVESATEAAVLTNGIGCDSSCDSHQNAIANKDDEELSISSSSASLPPTTVADVSAQIVTEAEPEVPVEALATEGNSGGGQSLLDTSVALSDTSFMIDASVVEDGSEEAEKDRPSAVVVSADSRVLIGRDELDRLLADAVDATEPPRDAFNALVDLYCALKRVVDSYAKKWDRTSLPAELEKEIKRFREEYPTDYEQPEEEHEVEQVDMITEMTDS